MNRRTFLLSAAGAIGAGTALIYGPLVVGQEFEQFVAGELGISDELAAAMLERARDSYSQLEYEAHAAAFAAAFRGPAAALVPSAAKRAAAESLIEPMLSTQAAGLAYAEDSAEPLVAPCAGLVPVQ